MKVVGILTYSKYDLCWNLLRDLAQLDPLPDEVCIIDNGRRFLCEANLPFPVRLIRPEYNLGCSKSWNLLGRIYKQHDLFISNDDIVFLKADALDQLVKCQTPLVLTVGYAFFLIREHVWDAVGPFDEGIWPCCSEDDDHFKRVAYAGVPCLGVAGLVDQAKGGHTTIWSMFGSAPRWAERQVQFVKDKWNLSQYGDPINGRPWNGCYVSPLNWEYEYRRKVPSDINEHLGTLRTLASQCEHVTEFGTATGNSSIALLAANPRRLDCYDKAHLPESEILFHLRSGTHVRRLTADTLTTNIDPTDFLFIDTRHTRNQVFQELNRHGNKVRRFIAFHDTTLFGEKGEDGEPGIMPGINDWIRSNPCWKVVLKVDNNNGFLLLKKES